MGNDTELFKYKGVIVLHDLGLVIIHNTYYFYHSPADHRMILDIRFYMYIYNMAIVSMTLIITSLANSHHYKHVIGYIARLNNLVCTHDNIIQALLQINYTCVKKAMI